VTGRERRAVARLLTAVRHAISDDAIPCARHHYAVGFASGALEAVARDMAVPESNVTLLADEHREQLDEFVSQLRKTAPTDDSQ
jgi:hypothetical protein